MQSLAVEPRAPRTICARCRRPASVCYCAALPALETATRIVILQHPRERDMPIGTARMASLCLPNAQLHVGIRWDSHAKLAAALGDPSHPPILLYPGPGARDILAEPPPSPVTLVVVDGTWSQAKTVVRDNPILHALPRYAFATPEPSHYRIRKEPRAEYVSTIEALMHVLGALEGSPERFRALLDPLNAMVDAQLAAQARSPRRYTARVPRAERTPRRPLDVPFEDIVVVVGEANAWPYDAGVNPQRDELVHWLAHRVATNETFSMIARPERAISPTTSFHTRLSEETLLAGTSRSAVFEAFRAWCKPTDAMLSWGHYGPSLVLDAGGWLPATRIDMRAAAQRYESKKLGTLDEYAASLGFASRASALPASAPPASAPPASAPPASAPPAIAPPASAPPAIAPPASAPPAIAPSAPSTSRHASAPANAPSTSPEGPRGVYERALRGAIGQQRDAAPGRGGERLAMLAHIVRVWHALDTRP